MVAARRPRAAVGMVQDAVSSRCRRRSASTTRSSSRRRCCSARRPPRSRSSSHALVYSSGAAARVRQAAFNAAALALVDVGERAGVLHAGAASRRWQSAHAPIAPLIVPLLALDGHLFRAQFRPDGGRRRSRQRGSRRSRSGRSNFRWLWVGYLGAASVAFCLILLLQQVSFDRGGDGAAAAGGVPSRRCARRSAGSRTRDAISATWIGSTCPRSRRWRWRSTPKTT